MNMKHILFALIVLVAAPQAGLAGERRRDQQPMCDNAKMPPEAQRINETFTANMKKPEPELMPNRAVQSRLVVGSRQRPETAARRSGAGLERKKFHPPTSSWCAPTLAWAGR
jgi:hypothetical protein